MLPEQGSVNSVAWAGIIRGLKLTLTRKPHACLQRWALSSFVVSPLQLVHVLKWLDFFVQETPQMLREENKKDLLLYDFMPYLTKLFGDKCPGGNGFLQACFSLCYFCISLCSISLCLIIYFSIFLKLEDIFSVGRYGRRPQERHTSHVQNTLIHGWNANPCNRIIIVYLQWNCTRGFVITLINLDPNEARLFCMTAELIYAIWVKKDQIKCDGKRDCRQALHPREDACASLQASWPLSSAKIFFQLLESKIIHLVNSSLNILIKVLSHLFYMW